MRTPQFNLIILLSFTILTAGGCATKKHVRDRVNERVTPLENRTSELEETSRRNTQSIGELRTGVDDVRGRADKAQQTADSAASSAEQANTRVTGIERNVDELRASLDKYSVTNTAMVFFKPGSAKLTPDAQAQLDQIAVQITDRNGFVLEIIGFGDTEHETHYNELLAQLRAEAVQRYLADKHNVSLMRMFAIGFGAARPVTQNVSTTDPTGAPKSPRELNRRVEIRLLHYEAAAIDGEMPQFPWPPPRPSAFSDIPSGILQNPGGNTFLKDVSQRLTEAFDHAGYAEKSWYAVPGGFAIVSRIEQFDIEGKSLDGQDRWSVQVSRRPIKTLGDYLTILFKANKGHYRVIVFVVTNIPFTQDGAVIGPDDAREWILAGFSRLPGKIGDLNFSDGFTCKALIYEFEKASPESEAKFKNPSGISGMTHLEKSGIWASLQR